MGIAEQSGTCVAAGLAKEGKIPFFGTYGVFAAGRALDQVRTTVCYGNWNVKIAGAHGGVSVGPDGATHQALEEIFQIAGLPNMNLLVPADSTETKNTANYAANLSFSLNSWRRHPFNSAICSQNRPRMVSRCS